MSRYASNTEVGVHRSKAEIERTIERYGADQFISGWDAGRETAMIGFSMHNRQIRFILTMPDRSSDEFHQTETGRARKGDAAYKSWEQACRQRWRALALAIKAKLEAVESGIAEFEDEFLANIVLPDGQTFGEWATPRIEKAYADGTMPEMLPALPRGKK